MTSNAIPPVPGGRAGDTSARLPSWKKWSALIAQRYGSKRAMLAYYSHLLAYRIGFLRNFERIEWPQVERLVFVCMGNICRSPYAEAVAAGLRMPVVSAGLNAQSGVCANPDAIRNAERRGVDLRGHAAQRIDDLDIGPADLLIGMEPWQVHTLHVRAAMDISGDRRDKRRKPGGTHESNLACSEQPTGKIENRQWLG